MPEDSSATTAQASSLKITDDVRAKFPNLIAMIEKSQSMNNEERQYWIDVLPIMNEGQIDNLKNILDNEKNEIEAAEKEYEDTMQKEAGNAIARFDEIKYLEKKRARQEAEKQHELEEKEHEEDLLKELETI